MPSQVVNLPALVAQATGTGSFTQGIGSLDDASSITIFLASSAGVAIGALRLQIAQFDPNIPAPSGVTQSTGWFSYSTAVVSDVFTSSGYAVTISPISFRGIRLIGTSSAATNEIVAFASKQISV